jgi:hypothetical protein
MPESNNNSTHNSSTSWLWNVTLLLAIISGTFIFLWAIYCDAYFRAFSFPYRFFSLPNMFILNKLISHIILINLPILLTALFIFYNVLKSSFPCRDQLRYGLYACIVVLFIFVYGPFWLHSFTTLADPFYFQLREIGIFITNFIHNFIILIVLIAILLIISYCLIPYLNQENYRNLKGYLNTPKDKFQLIILIFIIIAAINYAAVVLYASYTAESLIHGGSGNYIFESPDVNNTSYPHFAGKTLIFVLTQERNYYLVEKDKNYTATNYTPIPLHILNADKIKTATLTKLR